MTDEAQQPVTTQPAQAPAKTPWKSKTLWVNLILAAAAFFPETQAFLGDHPELFVFVFAAVNFGLRLVTKSGIQIDQQ